MLTIICRHSFKHDWRQRTASVSRPKSPEWIAPLYLPPVRPGKAQQRKPLEVLIPQGGCAKGFPSRWFHFGDAQPEGLSSAILLPSLHLCRQVPKQPTLCPGPVALVVASPFFSYFGRLACYVEEERFIDEFIEIRLLLEPPFWCFFCRS
jgi:hypothetical protein